MPPIRRRVFWLRCLAYGSAIFYSLIQTGAPRQRGLHRSRGRSLRVKNSSVRGSGKKMAPSGSVSKRTQRLRVRPCRITVPTAEVGALSSASKSLRVSNTSLVCSVILIRKKGVSKQWDYWGSGRTRDTRRLCDTLRRLLCWSCSKSCRG